MSQIVWPDYTGLASKRKKRTSRQLSHNEYFSTECGSLLVQVGKKNLKESRRKAGYVYRLIEVIDAMKVEFISEDQYSYGR